MKLDVSLSDDSFHDDDEDDDDFDESFELLGGPRSPGRSRGEPVLRQRHRHNLLSSSSSSRCYVTSRIKLAALTLLLGCVLGYLVLFPSSKDGGGAQGGTSTGSSSEGYGLLDDTELVQKVQTAGSTKAKAADSSSSTSTSTSTSASTSTSSDDIATDDSVDDMDDGAGGSVGVGVDVKEAKESAADEPDRGDGDGARSSSSNGTADDSQATPSDDSSDSADTSEVEMGSDVDEDNSSTEESADGAEDSNGKDDKGGQGTEEGGAVKIASNAPTMIHPQCVDPGTLKDSQQSSQPDRPVLILKYARTGSTWLVWSGQTLMLSNNRTMIWTSEVQGCGQPYSDDLMEWFMEYYHPRSRDTRMRLNSRPLFQNEKCLLSSGKPYVDHVTKDLPGHEKKRDRKTELGSFVSTIDWKIATRNTNEDGNVTLTTLDWQTDDPYHKKGDNVLGRDIPDLTLTQWGQLFQSVPNLALGVLVRTNSVKRAVSRLASEDQARICGSKKLRGDEECLKDLPDKVYINTTQLWDDIKVNDMKRDILPKLVAHIATTFGKGKMFCLSYESMQRDIAGQMGGLGKFLGADMEPSSLKKLREGADSTSYKRGSDDLSEYLKNYDEVRESLSKHPCLLAQLEDKSKGDDFPPCNVWQQ